MTVLPVEIRDTQFFQLAKQGVVDQKKLIALIAMQVKTRQRKTRTDNPSFFL